MLTETVATDGKPACLQPGNRPERELWLLDQLTLLAEAYGESGEKVSAQRLEIYVNALSDLSQAQLAVAFNRAVAELKFFPKVAELRDLAGASAKELRETGALVAWHEVLNVLSKWGVDRRCHAIYGPAPKLGSRTEFAIRCVGGLDRLNRAADTEFGYMEHQFIEAWQGYDAAKAVSFKELVTALDGENLHMERLLVTRRMEPEPQQARLDDAERCLPATVSPKPKLYGGAPLGDENWQARQAELRSQAAEAERRAAQIAAEFTAQRRASEALQPAR